MAQTTQPCDDPDGGENRFRSLFDGFNDAVFIHDAATGRLLDVNARMCEMYGCTREQALASDVARFSSGDEPYTLEQALERLKRAAEGQPQVFDWRARTWQSRLFWVEVGMRAVNIAGETQVLATVRDNTARRNAEEELRASKAMLQLVLDGIPVRVHWKDLNSVYLGGNRNFALDAELDSPEKLVGKTDDDLPWRQFAPMYQEKDRKVIQSGQPLLNYEQPRMTSDGSIRCLLQSKLPFRDAGGRIIGVLSIYEDITRRKADEEALKTSERQYRELVENVNSIILRWSRSGEITFLNRFGLEFFGYRPEEVLGKHVVGLLVPESDTQGHDLRRLMDRITENPAAFEHNVNENMVKGGGRVWIAWTNRLVFDAKGQVTEILSVGTDITEQRRTEEQVRQSNSELQALNRISAACVGSLDIHSVLDKVLGEILAATGLEGGAFCLAEPDGHLRCMAERGGLDAVGVGALEHPKKVGECLCGNCARDLNPLLLDNPAAIQARLSPGAHGGGLSLHASYPLVHGGECVGVLCVFTRTGAKPNERRLKLLETIAAQMALAIVNAHLHEETVRHAESLERRVAERTRELAEAVERLKELDRLKSEFLATMSHELRTPLNTIIGFTGILRNGMVGPVNEDQAKQLGMVFQSARHLLTLINDLLDLSRIEAGRIELEIKPFEFQAVVDEVLEGLRPAADQKGIRLRAEMADGPLKMTGDSRRCYQVLLNLVNNAVKFTDRGEVVVRAGAEGGRLRAAVCDTGIGIRPEHVGMLFEAFRQVDGSARRVYEGTGLGLHLCRKILALMGGDIGVESEFGKGSCFSFSLPLDLPPRGPSGKAGS